MSKLVPALIVALVVMSCLTACGGGRGSDYSGSREFWKRQGPPVQ
jgi:hypothetical protein